MFYVFVLLPSPPPPPSPRPLLSKVKWDFCRFLRTNLIAWLNYWEIVYVPSLEKWNLRKILCCFFRLDELHGSSTMIRKELSTTSGEIFHEKLYFFFFPSWRQNYYKLWHFYWVSKRQRNEIFCWLLYSLCGRLSYRNHVEGNCKKINYTSCS